MVDSRILRGQTRKLWGILSAVILKIAANEKLVIAVLSQVVIQFGNVDVQIRRHWGAERERTQIGIGARRIRKRVEVQSRQRIWIWSRPPRARSGAIIHSRDIGGG